MYWQGFLARGLRPRGERDVGSFGGHCPRSTETPEGRQLLAVQAPWARGSQNCRNEDPSPSQLQLGFLGGRGVRVGGSGEGLRYLLDTRNTGLLCRVSRSSGPSQPDSSDCPPGLGERDSKEAECQLVLRTVDIACLSFPSFKTTQRDSTENPGVRVRYSNVPTCNVERGRGCRKTKKA